MSDALRRSGKRDIWTIVLFTMLLAAGLVIVGIGIAVALDSGDLTVLALGVVAVVVPASIYPLVSRGGGAGGGEQQAMLREISERLLLTDRAKSIAFRQKDRDALREAIIEDMRKGDYDAALVLVEEMAANFGYREEAEQFRQQILDVLNQQREEKILKAIEDLDAICARHDWPAANREVERLRRLFPESRRVETLTSRVEEARENHKRELERQFLHAAETGDADNAMVLLKELDKYLTPAEAEPYREAARGVIGQARENLGVRFKMAIHDRDWIDALRMGETIIREFPNTKMAEEVRQMLDVLRERAAGQRAADEGR
jgi:hypothetical protein